MSKVVASVAIAIAIAGAVCAPAGSRSVLEHSALRISPLVIEFGASPSGAARTRSVTITNVSSEPIQLSAAFDAGSRLDPGFGFPVGDSCLQQEVEVFEPGQSCTLTFTFSPTAPGVAQARFVFSIDGWQSIAGAVQLTGRGPS